MELRADLRKRSRASEGDWIPVLAIALFAAMAGGIAYVQKSHRASESPGAPSVPQVGSAPVVYVYRCDDGKVQSAPCGTQVAPLPVPPAYDLPPMSTYRAPRLSEDPGARRLMAEADARYQREVEAARRPGAYEQTTAITRSNTCTSIRAARDRIDDAMRHGYSSELGERYRRSHRELWNLGIRHGCWNGSLPPD